MKFLNLLFLDENRLEPKKKFHTEIETYYNSISDNRIPKELLAEIIQKVSDQIYEDYKRFWKQYPKSRKRYSKLKLEDVKHPFVRYSITDFLKTKNLLKYRDFSKILFEMNDLEFDEYEESKHWYETK